MAFIIDHCDLDRGGTDINTKTVVLCQGDLLLKSRHYNINLFSRIYKLRNSKTDYKSCISTAVQPVTADDPEGLGKTQYRIRDKGIQTAPARNRRSVLP